MERLVRYCARPMLAGQRLGWAEPDQPLIFHRPKPRPDGQTALYLTPLAFLDHLAALVPPPRKYRDRYYGVLVPNSPLRRAVTAYAGLPMDLPSRSIVFNGSPDHTRSCPDEGPARVPPL